MLSIVTDVILVVLLGLGILVDVSRVRVLRVALPVSVLPRVVLSALPLLVDGRMRVKVRRERRINRLQRPPPAGCGYMFNGIVYLCLYLCIYLCL